MAVFRILHQTGKLMDFPFRQCCAGPAFGRASPFESADPVRNPASSEGSVNELRRYRKLNSINEMRELFGCFPGECEPSGPTRHITIDASAGLRKRSADDRRPARRVQALKSAPIGCFYEFLLRAQKCSNT